MIIIGIGHYSRVGKDTLANSILKSLEEQGVAGAALNAAKGSFAWKLKKVCHDLYGWAGLREPEFYETPDGEKLRDVLLPAIGKTPVEIWVAVGNVMRDAVYPKTWIDYLLKSDLGLDVLIIPDVRYRNEVEAVREAGGHLVKVVRPGIAPKQTVADQALWGWYGWDNVLGMGGDIRDLQQWGRAYARMITAGVPFPVLSEEEVRSRCESCEGSYSAVTSQ